MKKIFSGLLLLVLFVTVACDRTEQRIVILSTNDIHAQIQRMPQLATAIRECRDTATVILVDAGDRWTGNAFVDLADEPCRPVIDLMNKLDYDAATLGNHEFDAGQAFLGEILDDFDFKVICANVISDTISFPQIDPYVIIERNGVRIGFVGVVTNYERNNHPAGEDENFAGLTFPDPQEMATKYAAELKDRCDVLVLLSHMGDDRDVEFAEANGVYDIIIGGHTHEKINKTVNNTLVTQTGKYLANIGVTEIKMKGRKIESLSYRLVSLDDYTPDGQMQDEVDEYYENERLLTPIGELSTPANKVGLANMITSQIADRTDSEIGFYHVGGVRRDTLKEGGVTVADVYDIDPFGSTIYTFEMTPAQMRRMIISKFNDKINQKEAHRIDLFSTTPYIITTDSLFDATDVVFPTLVEGRKYKVAIGEYVISTYNDLEYTDGNATGVLLTKTLIDFINDASPVKPDNTTHQQIK